MPTVASGEVRQSGDLFSVRVTVVGKKRISLTLRPGTTATEAKQFAIKASRLALQMRKNRASARHIENALVESASSGLIVEMKPNRLFGVYLTDEEAMTILGKVGVACIRKLSGP